MKYTLKITVEKEPREGENYPRSETIYEQLFYDGRLDVLAVIKAANEIIEDYGV
jgi:hypothetical protein